VPLTDLVLVNLETIRMGSIWDPIRNLVYGVTDQDGDRVVIDDKTVVENGKVLGIDERRIVEDLQRIGDHFIDTILSRNKEGKTAEDISPLSFRDY